MRKYFIIILILAGFISQAQLQPLKISGNKRYFQTKDGKPFFWLGDTGWLLFVKCNRQDALNYLEDRKQKGFNVIQVMLLHDINLGVNVYGDSAFQNKDVSKARTTTGNNFQDDSQYDFWDHVDFIVAEAEKRGIYMAMVPVWGGNVKHISEAQAGVYASFLGNRYKNNSNIIWLNGGDIKGTDGINVWKKIGNTLRAVDQNHLITFHPRGRNSSSAWFHNEPWLDFNMFQSGHRSYAQDTSANETLHYGEDNWKFVDYDYNLKPTKPTLDAEPSYEDIPYGLHRSDEPYWQDFEIRRYAWWSVLAGGSGFTYGHNSVMQFYTPGDSGISFFPRVPWKQALDAPGARQMQFLKKLLLSKPYLQRKPDQAMIANQGERYNYLVASRGKKYAFIYTYNGRDIKLNLGRCAGKTVKCSWYNPRNGEYIAIGTFRNRGIKFFDPPGIEKEGNDWVLQLQGH